MIKFFKKIFNRINFELKNDPIRCCPLYKKEGCSFVDSYLCGYPKCSILENYYIYVYKKRLKKNK